MAWRSWRISEAFSKAEREKGSMGVMIEQGLIVRDSPEGYLLFHSVFASCAEACMYNHCAKKERVG